MSGIAKALAGLSFLVIGESHFMYDLRESLHRDLLDQGASHVYSIGACGASAMDWVKPRQVDCSAEQVDLSPAKLDTKKGETRGITQLISSIKPDVVMLVIGDTMGAYGDEVYPRAWAWQGISALTKEITQTGADCVWVGPAYGREGGTYSKKDVHVERVDRFLSSNVQPCSYISSIDFAEPGQWRTVDGQHFTEQGYAEWSRAIVSEVVQLPLILDLTQ